MVRVFLTGAHSENTPLSLPAFASVFSDRIKAVDRPELADVYLFAHLTDIKKASRELVDDWLKRHRPIVLLSDDPLWDTVWGKKPLARTILVDSKFGDLPVIQLNHQTSDIFNFDKIPYFLLKNEEYEARYRHMFDRNRSLTPNDWKGVFECRAEKISLAFASRLETSYNITWPQDDLFSLGAWRSNLSDSVASFNHTINQDKVEKKSLFQKQNPHLAGQVQLVGAIENTHSKNFITDQFFSAFANGAIPIYVASSAHSVNKLQLSNQSWINLFGLSIEAAVQEITQWVPSLDILHEYFETQERLSSLFCEPFNWSEERNRVGSELIFELEKASEQANTSTFIPKPEPARPIIRSSIFGNNNADIKPAVLPTYIPNTRDDLFDSSSPLSKFFNFHAAEQAVIVCNGPSLNKMNDLSILNNKLTFGLNKIHLGVEKFGFTPRYLVSVNDKVIKQSAESWLNQSMTKFLSERCTSDIPYDDRTYFIRTSGIRAPVLADITQGVREGHTVTHAALQIAFFMGVQEVVIIGMDHKFSYEGAVNAPLHMRGADPNHFSDDYFRDQDWDAPNLMGSEQSYRAARALFERDGRKIFDATLGGHCNIFEKADFASILK